MHAASPRSFLCTVLLLAPFALRVSGQETLFKYTDVMERVKGQMLGSIRQSWEQGTAASALLEFDTPQYSLWGADPFGASDGRGDPLPMSTLQLALSAVVRQGSQGRLSQANSDGSALDGAANGHAVLVGSVTQPSRKDYWRKAADAQLNYPLHKARRTNTGALSHRTSTRQYWSDGVYMAFPFIAYYGAIHHDRTYLQFAYDQCRLYRNALLKSGPTGKLWAHIYSDDSKRFLDSGLWASGNGWAAKGMLDVAIIIERSAYDSSMKDQKEDLLDWVQQILDGTFDALDSDDLVPNYIGASGARAFGDASASAALAGVAYRAAQRWPSKFGKKYSDAANKIREAVTSRVDELGLLRPVVNPLSWDYVGVLSTEAQAFALQMWAAWRDWSSSQ